MPEKDSYVKALQADKENTASYYLKSFEIKTEQQKMLEKLVQRDGKTYPEIADIACGSGSLSYHLSAIFDQSSFTLVDLNEDGLKIAREKINNDKFSFICDSVYSLEKIPDGKFDLTICWQTLSWLDQPELALQQLLRITKSGGKIFLSSLFNIDHDVDIYSRVVDHTRVSAAADLFYSYNTYSVSTIEKWLGRQAENFQVHPFNPDIDFAFSGRGIGTYTEKTEKGKRLQFSAGMLLNWCILEITKK